jgi:plasmid replication initiation protein
MKLIDNKKDVSLSNNLVASKFHLTREEQNLVLLVASQISKYDEDFKDYKVTVKDLEDATGVKHNRQRIKDMSLSIMSKPIVLPDSKAVVNWFSCIEPIENETALQVRFDKKLKPFLLHLEQYTKAELSHIFSFKNKYSSRLYLLLKSEYGKQSKHKKNVDVELGVEYLITQFVMPKSYGQRYSKFKEFLIDGALEEINEKTDLQIGYKELKTGRKITSIEFCITEKEKSVEDLKKSITATKTKSDFLPNALNSKAIDILLDEELGLEKHDLKNIFDHYKIEDIEDICEELFRCWDSSKLMSKQGFFRGRLKQLNRKKTENQEIPFGFDEIDNTDEIIKAFMGLGDIDDDDEFNEFLEYKLKQQEITKSQYNKLLRR